MPITSTQRTQIIHALKKHVPKEPIQKPETPLPEAVTSVPLTTLLIGREVTAPAKKDHQGLQKAYNKLFLPSMRPTDEMVKTGNKNMLAVMSAEKALSEARHSTGLAVKGSEEPEQAKALKEHFTKMTKAEETFNTALSGLRKFVDTHTSKLQKRKAEEPLTAKGRKRARKQAVKKEVSPFQENSTASARPKRKVVTTNNETVRAKRSRKATS